MLLFLFNLVTDEVISLNYLRYRKGIRVPIPIEHKNEDVSPAIKRGGFALIPTRYILVRVLEPKILPKSIPIDLANYNSRVVIRARDLTLPDFLELAPGEENKIVSSVHSAKENQLVIDRD